LRVLLINPFYPISETPSPPLGLAFLAGALERTGNQVKLLDCVVFPFSREFWRRWWGISNRIWLEPQP
jgi:anaerobic magnesium-protoporphyrin IX monomethyl ester cyclase